MSGTIAQGRHLAVISSAVLLTCAAGAAADWTITKQDRFVYAYAVRVGTLGSPVETQEQTIAAPDFGPFQESLTLQYGSIVARGHGSQLSQLGPAQITGNGRAEGEGRRGSIGSLGGGTGESFLEVTIVLTETTTIRLQGEVSAGIISGPVSSDEATAWLRLAPLGGSPLLSVQANRPGGPPSANLDQVVILAPGSYTLSARAWARCVNNNDLVNRIIGGEFDFTLSEVPCYPDCNGDGALNLADFGCFQTKFALGDPYADCNGDGVRNLSDFGCFTTKFALGCP